MMAFYWRPGNFSKIISNLATHMVERFELSNPASWPEFFEYLSIMGYPCSPIIINGAYCGFEISDEDAMILMIKFG